MTSEELAVLPDATLLAIARTVKHCEASEAQGELVLELAKRLARWIDAYTALYDTYIAVEDTRFESNDYAANLLLRD